MHCDAQQAYQPPKIKKKLKNTSHSYNHLSKRGRIAKKVEKGKGKCIYIALIFVVHAKRSGIDHTVLPAITPMPAFAS